MSALPVWLQTLLAAHPHLVGEPAITREGLLWPTGDMFPWEELVRLGLVTHEEIEAALAPPKVEEIVEAFLETRTVVDRQAYTSTQDLLAAATAWANERGEFHFGKRMLARQLRARGAVPQRTNTQRGWRGVRLR